jgi:putative flavoprotein involved in K+ transport
LKNGLDAPSEILPRLRDGYNAQQLSEINLNNAKIKTVIWATGYSFDLSLVHLPIFDGDGYPIQKRGVTDYPGLHFVGLPWLHNARSGSLWGVAQDALEEQSIAQDRVPSSEFAIQAAAI